MKAKSKTKIEIAPVGWRGNKVLKFQAVATLTKGDVDVCRIYGEPEDTEDEAVKSLIRSCDDYVTLGSEAMIQIFNKK